MASKDKKLCKWGEGQYGKNIKKISSVVLPPKYICEKCGRVASSKKSVCKPAKLDV